MKKLGKIKKKIKKRKRNSDKIKPINLNLFINLLNDSISYSNSLYFSKALSYRILGEDRCDDCRKFYDYCICEGKSDDGSAIDGPCEECLQNYCVCGYDLSTNNGFVKSVYNVAIKYLSFDQLLIFVNSLHTTLKYNYSLEKQNKENLKNLINKLYSYNKNHDSQ